MSRFSADWLTLREDADARARSPDLVEALPDSVPLIVDLGSGTGSNLRWLAPRLGPNQRWSLVDNDVLLLEAARRALKEWTLAAGWNFGLCQDRIRIAGSGFDCDLAFEHCDLATEWPAADLAEGSLVTASALLDLVSEGWLDRLVAWVAASRSIALLALSFDGRVRIEPVMDEDETIVGLLNRHQKTDKGFGPALGPEAWRVASRSFESSGCDVQVRASDWQCDAADRPMLASLLGGWRDCAVSMSPFDRPAIDLWFHKRMEQIERGSIAVTVGHRDVLALPKA